MRYAVPLFILLLSLTRDSLEAQESLLHDRIYLKDGTLLIGHILDSDSTTISVEMVNLQKTLSVPRSKIIRIKSHSEEVYLYKKNKYHYLKGNFLHLSLGGGLGFGSSGHLDATYARRLSPSLSLGIGFGLAEVDDPNWFNGFEFLSSHIYSRYYLSQKTAKTKLYISAKAGYAKAIPKRSFFITRTYSGGPVVNPAIGFHWASRGKTKFSLEMNYFFQTTEINFPFISHDPNIGAEGTLSQKRRLQRNLVTLNIDIG